MTLMKVLDSLAAPWITALLNGIWQACLLTIAVAAALRFAKGLNASTRYAVWWVTLSATLALAAVNLGSLIVPHATVPQATEPRQAIPKQAVVQSPAPHRFVPLAQSIVTHAPAPIVSTPAAPSRSPVKVRLGWIPLGVAFLWPAAVVLMLARVAASLWKLTRLRMRATTAPSAHVMRVRELAGRCGLARVVRLGSSADLRTPVAAGLYRPTVLIPAALLPRLTESEFDQIAVHELAHIRRWDDWANLLQRVIDAIFVFHPAVRFISRQLDLEREIACDDLVLERTGGARDYAACLTRLVEMTGWARQSALAPGATIYKSHLARRVEKLLDRTRNAHPGIARRVVWGLGVALVLLVLSSSRVPAMWAFASETDGLVAPALHLHLPPVLMAMAGGQSYTSYTSNSHDHYTEVRWKQNGRAFELEIQGEIEFTDDDDDVKSLSPGGQFRMSEEGSPDRRYVVRGDDSGRLSRTYFESGRAVPMNGGGRGWLAARLPETIRETGVGAAKRVQRILSRKGPDGVAAEIGLIRSDGSKRLYLEEFLLHGKLDEAHLRGGMRLARGVSSDGDKRALLTAVAPLYLRDGLRPDLFDAIATISSDGEHARILSDLVNADPTNRETLLLTARSAGRISSDGEKARVLIEVSGHYRGNEEMRSAWFATLNGVSSDGEKRGALSAIIAHDGKDRDTLVEALKSASGISSDGERAQLLVESSGYYMEDAAIRRSFFAAVDGISSDGEKHRALAALYQRSSKNPATVKMIIRSAKGISSDGEKAAMLGDVAGPLVGDPALRDDFFEACNSIASDGEHARVLLRLVSGGDPGEAALVKVIESATRISSDGEKATVLAQVIQMHSPNAAVQAALRKSLKSVSSDGEFRRLSQALNN